MTGRDRAEGPVTRWYNNQDLALNNVLPSFIHDYAAQRYWNTTDGETGFPLSTLRTSNATTIDKQGRLAWAPHQLCGRGQDISAWSIGVDGTITLSGNYAPSGAPAYNVQWTTPTPGAGAALTTQPVVLGAGMSFSVYLRYVNHEWARIVIYSGNNASNQNRCWVNLITKTLGNVENGNAATNTTANIQDVGGGWVRVTVSGGMPWFSTTDGSLLVTSAIDNASGTRAGDGATIEVASAIFEMTGAQTPQDWRPEFNTSGSAKYLPRFEYNHNTGAFRGLRIEPQQTNIIAQSVGGGAFWVASGATVTDGATVWGFPTAVITGNGSGSQQYAYFNGSGLSATSGSSYSVSAHVKRGTSRYVQLTTSANYNVPSTTAPYINYDFDTNTFTSGGTSLIANSAFAYQLADGWVRIGVSFTANTTATGSSCLVAIVDNLSATRLAAATSDGLTVLSFGHQTESQGMATSYIPTYGVTATRNADNFTLTSIPWFNQIEGSIYVKAVPAQSDSVSTRRLINFSDGTSNNRYELSRNNSQRMQGVSAVGGVVTFNPSSATSTTDYVSFKALMTYTTALRRVVLNGDTVATNATVGPSSGMTQVIIGSAIGLPVSNTFGGWLQEIRYYGDGSATDAQIQSMTV